MTEIKLNVFEMHLQKIKTRKKKKLFNSFLNQEVYATQSF